MKRASVASRVHRLLWQTFLIVLPFISSATTNDLAGALQRGLFEEEANRNLDAAAQAYQAVSAQFDKDRRLAATAIFRLGEVYRKQNKTNEAVAQYERIVREFADQTTLATLSQQNLAGLSTKPETTSTLPLTSAARREQKQLLEQEIKLVEEELGRLKDLFDKKLVAQSELRAKERELLKLRQQAVALNVEAESPTASVTAGTLTTDDEEKEIRRIQVMIQNSPDLINAPGFGVNHNVTPLCGAASAGWLRVVTFLLDHGATIEKCGNNSTPLHEAVKAGNRAMVELLLDRGASLTATDGAGSAPLHHAAAHGYLSVAEVLLQRKANLEARTSQANGSQTPLELAATKGHSAVIALLVGKGAEFRSAIIQAAIGGHADALRKLIELGAKPDAEDPPGVTALSFAAERGNVEAVKILLAGKAKPNAGTNKPPLVMAALGKHVEIAELLLRAGADPNSEGKVPGYLPAPGEGSGGFQRQSGNWMTPLQIALAKSDVALVKLLLQNKADANSKSHEESSWASPPNPLTRWALVNPEMLKLFLEAGADANAEAWSDWSLLSAAASRGRAEAVELLLKHGAKPDVFDSEGETPLSRAAGKDCVTCVQALLRFKANPNFRTKVGGTPLLSAVAAGFATNVATLLNAGADPNMSYDNGWAPVHGAVWDWRWEILEMLLAKGANPNVRSGHYGSPLDLIKQPTSGRRTPGQGPTEPGAELFAALLRKNGAMDDLPDFNSIGVSRASSGHRATVFMLGTNRWNRFTLTELIAKQLGLLSTEFASRWTRKSDSRLTLWNGSPIRFPDFSRITIHHADPREFHSRHRRERQTDRSGIATRRRGGNSRGRSSGQRILARPDGGRIAGVDQRAGARRDARDCRPVHGTATDN
jgi:ankyrin repeat protein